MQKTPPISFLKIKKNKRLKINYFRLSNLDSVYGSVKSVSQINYIVIKQFTSVWQWARYIFPYYSVADRILVLKKIDRKNLAGVFSKGNLFWIYPMVRDENISFGEERNRAIKELNGILVTKHTLQFLKLHGKSIIEEPTIEVCWR
jgi:hypothetical protein